MNEIEITIRTRDLSRQGFQGAERNAQNFQARAGEAFKKFGTMAAAGGLVAGLAVAKLGVVVTNLASDSQQSLGATQAVFGKYSDAVIKRSKEAADAVGLSANEYRESANLIGSLLKNQGVATDQLADKTDDLIKMGADLAAMYGGTAAEAVEALSAAYKGEFDVLDRYGISLSAAKIEQEAYNVAQVDGAAAFGKLSQKAQDQAKQQATTNLIMGQGKDAIGTFNRESDTLANKIQTVKAKFKDLGASLGEAFLPVATDVADKLGDMAKTLQTDIPKAIKKFEDSYNGINLDDSTLSGVASELANINRELSSGATEADGTVDAWQRVKDFFAEIPVSFLAGVTDLVNGFKRIKYAIEGFGLQIRQKALETVLGIQETFAKLPGPVGRKFKKLAADNRRILGEIQDDMDKLNTKKQQREVSALQTRLRRLGAQRPTPKINADTSAALAKLARLTARLHKIPDEYVNVYISEVKRDNVNGGHHVGGYAHGGVIGAAATGGMRSGLTMVGEHGRELVNLAPGSTVHSNPDTERMLSAGGGGGAMTLVLESGGSKLDDLLVEIIRRAVRIKGGNVQSVLGKAF